MANCNPANLNQSIIRHRPTSLSFGIYTDDDVRQRSVCEISSSLTYDALDNPLPRGLYDPLLGPTIAESCNNAAASTCVTCGQVQMLCPGHFGHVELCVPIMHPLFFPKLVLFMKMKCLACHDFRLSRRQCRIFAVKLHLIDVGRVKEALELDEELASISAQDVGEAAESSMGELLEKADGKKEKSSSSSASKAAAIAQSARLMGELLDKKLALLPPMTGSSQPPLQHGGLTMHERSIRRQILKDFQSACSKCVKCANCSAFSPKVRHDQFNKMFQSPLGEKNRQRNHAKGVKIRSACGIVGGNSVFYDGDGDEDSDDERDSEDEMVMDDDDDEEEELHDEANTSQDLIDDEAAEDNPSSKNGQSKKRKKSQIDLDGKEGSKKQDKFMNTLEIEAQCKLTWEKQPYLCSKFFGNAHTPDAGDGGGGGISGSALLNYVTEDEGGNNNNGGNQQRRPRSTSNAAEHLPGSGKGYTLFFLRTLSVPPSRFRPPVVMANMTVEHSQNFYLSKVIELNARLRSSFHVTRELITEERELRNALSNSADGTDIVRRLKTVREEKEKSQASSLGIWVDLQTQVNCFMDSTRDPKGTAAANSPNGIRQLLEKKEGIFRKHMMGKRVNFACRSVISPDPYIGTNEIGLPLYFAKTLTFPTPVNALNVSEMQTLVRNGAETYPGACWVEFSNGQRIDLIQMGERGRHAVAARLLSSGGSGMGSVKVGRQLRDGDMVLMNRQPTLHKPGIMAHRVRVLFSPTQTTLRMHYANCNTYNADYDGDEMNCHFPQSYLAASESNTIASTHEQFIVPTDGTPLRGLIQDHVDAGVKLTQLNTFLEREEYQQLLFAALGSLQGLEVVRSDCDIEMLPPAIAKPKELWTGKQVISTLLHHLRKGNDQDDDPTFDFPGLSMERKAKTPPSAFGPSYNEHMVIVRDGDLVQGVLDKAAFGASEFSLVHAIHEAYGQVRAGLLLDSLGRLFTAYIQYYAGHSCRMEDLILTSEADEKRRKLVQDTYTIGSRAAKAWADSDGGKIDIPPIAQDPNSKIPLKPHEKAAVASKIGELLSGSGEGKENAAALDGFMQSRVNPLASDMIKVCLPDGLAVPFPDNTFGLMVTTGAKGSMVNQSQVSCSLGQQALEGRRVPRLSSGRTLPSFAPYDPNPRADGFIADRFLTGIRPQEYYFHCMAGREGLVDTAVKTSRSGYLQRCLVKHLEELKVSYDHTVRDGEGGVVQFLYGEDGVDPTKAAHLDCEMRTFQFLARNHESLKRRYTALPGCSIDIAAADGERAKEVEEKGGSDQLKKGSFIKARKCRLGSEWVRGAMLEGWYDAKVTKVHKDGSHYDIKYIHDGKIIKRVPLVVNFNYSGSQKTPAQCFRCEIIKPGVPDPILSGREGEKHRIGSSGACVSEHVAGQARKAVKDSGVKTAIENSGLSKSDFGALVASKFGASLVHPGEAVGCIAAQSIGEPSTQMTLNTFHLAGSGANVTLGIPRLREIIMTASKQLKTPTMSVPIRPGVTDREATRLARDFSKITLMDLLSCHEGITVAETLKAVGSGSTNYDRAYYVTLKLHPAERIMEAFGLHLEDIAKTVTKTFLPKLARVMKAEMKRNADGDHASIEVIGGASTEFVESDNPDETSAAAERKIKKKRKEEEEYDDEAANDEDGVTGSRFGHRKEMTSYGRMDEDEKNIAKESVDDDENIDGSQETEQQPMMVSEGEDEEESDDGATDYTSNSTNSVKINREKNTLILNPLLVDPSGSPLLMVGLVERAAGDTIVRARPNISEGFVNNEEGRGRCLQTAGCHFEEIWKLDESIADHNELLSNHIWGIRCAYGVEAARKSIADQIRLVFGMYGISVDPRHLSLIADFMTYDGGYKPMNRIGMDDVSSTLLQMSFESTSVFMVDAARHKRSDQMMSPSANIVLGHTVRHGTGAFECIAKA